MVKNYKNQLVLLLLVFCGIVSAQDYSSLINGYLESNKSKLRVTSEDISDIEIYDQVYTKHNKVTHVYAIQKLNGVEVYNAVASIAIKDGQVVYVANSMQGNLRGRSNNATPSLNPLQAAVSATSELGLGNGNFSILSVLSSHQFILSDGGISQENIPVKLVYVPRENDIRLAWELDIYELSGAHWWNVRIDANTGELLDKVDRILNCSFDTHPHSTGENHSTTQEQLDFLSKEEIKVSSAILADEQYRVFAVPVESPAHGNRTLVTQPADLTASPFGWHDVDGDEGAEFTFTRGNNVWAKEDEAGNNGGGLSPDGGDDLIFDFEIDFTDEPAEYLEASTANLFYWNNVLHDVFFLYGFDEAAGNFQFTNYSGEGEGNDYIFAEAQDGSGLNNANFSRVPDGVNGRMQMFLWSPSSTPAFQVDSPASVAGFYGFSSANFGQAFPADGLTGDLALVEDADTTGDPNDACDPVSNSSTIAGKIAVMRLGDCEPTAQVLAAQEAGAIAAILINNEATPVVELEGEDPMVTIPSGMMSQVEGNVLLEELNSGSTITVTIATPSSVGKDGSLDNGIIAHEYGHGVSIRLTGGASNTGCVSGGEQMGEGWSDYFALIFTLEPGDTGADIRGIGTYADGEPITGQGIRPAAYSTDFATNDLTYDSTNDTANISAPHGVGTVWATMLWDITWALIDEYGFDEDLYNGTGGNNIALQLVMDGLKLQPCNIGFVDGRDAIIAAVDLNETITDEDKTAVKCLLWDKFAARGLGFSADQGSAGSRTDQVEAFDTPPNDVLNCENLSVGDVNTNIFKVYPNPSNGDINISIAQAQGEGTVTIYDINGRQVFAKNVALEGTVNIQAQGLSTGIYILEINGGNTSQTTKLIIE